MIILWYLSQIFKHQGLHFTYILLSHIKTGFSLLLFTKITKMTLFSLKDSNLGQITNLLINDLSVFEGRIASLIFASTFPIILIGSIALLMFRIGWVGIVGVILVLIYVPVSICISKKNGHIIEEANIFKDKRVQLTNETIQAIKSIKLYGWEIAFKKYI